MNQRRNLLLTAVFVCLFFILFAANPALARKGPTGTKTSQVGPRGGSAEGTRSTQGANAESEFTVKGKRSSVSGTASSTVKPGSAQGEAEVTTGRGKTANMSGEATVSGDTATGSGSIQTGGGKGAEVSGSATKTGEGVSASGTMTTNSGKTVDASVSGNKDSGTVTVETEKGEKSVDYGKYR